MYIIPFHPNKTATYTMIIHCYTDTHKPTNMPTLNYIACTDTVSYSVTNQEPTLAISLTCCTQQLGCHPEYSQQCQPGTPRPSDSLHWSTIITYLWSTVVIHCNFKGFKARARSRTQHNCFLIYNTESVQHDISLTYYTNCQQ